MKNIEFYLKLTQIVYVQLMNEYNIKNIIFFSILPKILILQ